MSGASIVVVARPDKSDMTSALWLLFWRRNTWAWLVLGSVVLGLFALPRNGSAEAAVVAAAALIAVMMFAHAIILEFSDRVGRVFARFGSATYRFCPTRLEVEAADGGAGTWSWSEFTHAFDNNQVLVLLRRVDPSHPLVFPKRQMADVWPRVRDLLSFALNERAAFQRMLAP